jgi:hypothetical protein
VEKVKAGKFTFPDFHDCCPICHSRKCAVRIGYYYRNVIQIQEKTEENYQQRIPVARFLCREIKKPKYKHRTFSLLPDNLIPYYSYTIDTLIFIILQILLNNDSTDNNPSDFKPIDKALENIDKVSPEDILLSEGILWRCLNLFHQARLKLILFSRKKWNKHTPFPGLENFTDFEILHFIMEFSLVKISKIKSNAGKFSLFYYFEEGSYTKNARFLFGTAYQFR